MSMESPHKDYYQEVSAVTPSRNLYGIGPRKETALRLMKLDTPGAMKDIDDDELDKRCRDAVQRMRNDDRKAGVERSDVAYKSFETKLKRDIKRVRDHSEDIVPWHLMCPISHDLLEDPVVLFTGTVFSKKHLETWVNDGKNVDPSTNIQLDSREYYPCLVLRGLVDDYKGSRMMRVPKRTPRASAGLYSASDADVGVDLCERNSTTTEQATKSGSVEGAPRTTDLEADPEVDQCEQGMQSIGVVERSASCNDDDGTMKNSTVDDVQSSPIPCTAATIVRPVMYRINQVTRAMFVHPTPYLSIGSARDTLTEAMFEVHEAEGPSGAISTPFSIRAASDARFSFPILLRIRLNELPRAHETLSVVKVSHDNGVDDEELLAHHVAVSLEPDEQFVQIELHHFCKIFAIRKAVQSEVDGQFADAGRQVVSIHNPTRHTIGFKATNYGMAVGVVNGRNQAGEGGVSVLPIRGSYGRGTSDSQSVTYTFSAETFVASILPGKYVLVFMDPEPANVPRTLYPQYSLTTMASNGRVVLISSGVLNSDIEHIDEYTDDELLQIPFAAAQ